MYVCLNTCAQASVSHPCLYPNSFLTLQFELCDNIELNPNSPKLVYSPPLVHITTPPARNGERVWGYGMIVGWS
jgi:hypothetical protein